MGAKFAQTEQVGSAGTGKFAGNCYLSIDHLKTLMSATANSKAILLFDGVCNLCNGFVQFVILRDKAGYFQFASLQSEEGQALLEQHGLDKTALSTVVLIERGKAYTHSAVALRVAPHLDGFWGWARIFWLIPVGIRDWIYNWIAKNRYRWFGKKEQCMLPRPEWKERFIG